MLIPFPAAIMENLEKLDISACRRDWDTIFGSNPTFSRSMIQTGENLATIISISGCNYGKNRKWHMRLYKWQ
jgi:hypothetical protein